MQEKLDKMQKFALEKMDALVTEERVCFICKEAKDKSDSTNAQRRKELDDNLLRICRACLQKRLGEERLCTECQCQLKKNATKKCKEFATKKGIIKRTCSNCKIQKTRDRFSKKKWKAAGRALVEGKCKDCVSNKRLCASCTKSKDKSCFRKKEWKKLTGVSNCNECINRGVAKQSEKVAEVTATALTNNDPPLFWIDRTGEIGQRRIGQLPDDAINAEKRRSHEVVTAERTVANTKKPRLLETYRYQEMTAPGGVPSGTVTAASFSAWMAQSNLHQAETPATDCLASVRGRGRGRGVDNRPAWMSRGCDVDRLSERYLGGPQAQPQPHDVDVFSANAASGGSVVKQEEHSIPKVKDVEHYTFNKDGSVWV